MMVCLTSVWLKFLLTVIMAYWSVVVTKSASDPVQWIR